VATIHWQNPVKRYAYRKPFNPRFNISTTRNEIKLRPADKEREIASTSKRSSPCAVATLSLNLDLKIKDEIDMNKISVLLAFEVSSGAKKATPIINTLVARSNRN
jgi:hypothetical protein